MKPLKLLFVIGMVFFLFPYCEKAEQQLPDPYLESFAVVEECLSFSPVKGDQPGPDRSCIFYEYDGDSTLKITHYNAGFNCCPEKVLTSFELRNDTIFIVEDDSLQLCRCNCLFNVEMTLHNLPSGKYVLKLGEPLVNQENELFIINLDLDRVTTDYICIYRDFYPWREE